MNKDDSFWGNFHPQHKADNSMWGDFHQHKIEIPPHAHKLPEMTDEERVKFLTATMAYINSGKDTGSFLFNASVREKGKIILNKITNIMKRS